MKTIETLKVIHEIGGRENGKLGQFETTVSAWPYLTADPRVLAIKDADTGALLWVDEKSILAAPMIIKMLKNRERLPEAVRAA